MKIVMKWLEDLLKKIEAVTDKEIKSREPKKEIDDGEEIIGSVPANLRKIQAYNSAMVEKANALIKAHNEGHGGLGHVSEACEKFKAVMGPIEDEIKMTKLLFWRELQNELSIDIENIGLRKGWKVVKIPEKEGIGIEIIGISGHIPSIAELIRMRSKL